MNRPPLTIMTMVFDIGRVHPFVLRKAFDLFYNAIARHHQNFKIIVYTNLPASWCQREGVEVHHEEEKDFAVLYPGIRWFNLTFHRFFILEKHMKMGEEVVWLDLDTIVCGNLDFTRDLPNFFIKHNFGENISTLNSQESLAQKEWIHGHAHKMDMNIVRLVNELLEKEREDMPHYELMSVFSLLRKRHPEQFLLLNDHTNKHINLEWCYEPSAKLRKVNSLSAEHFHPEPRFIKNRIKMVGGKLCGYDNREFLLMTFTFPTLEMNLRENWKSLADPQARECLRSLCKNTAADRWRFYLIYLKSLFKKDRLKKIPVFGPFLKKIWSLIDFKKVLG